MTFKPNIAKYKIRSNSNMILYFPWLLWVPVVDIGIITGNIEFSSVKILFTIKSLELSLVPSLNKSSGSKNLFILQVLIGT